MSESPDPGPDPQDAGRHLGSLYVLEERIGAGAQGEVWKGRARGSSEPLAFKILSYDLSLEHTVVEAFLRERKVLQKVSSPLVVRFRDLVVEGARLALVMDYVGGGDLRGLMGTQGPFEPAMAAWIGTCVAMGLAAIHQAGVIHRDIKPANILIDASTTPGTPRVADFGIARICDAAASTRSTLSGGTPLYMAPEVYEGGPQTPAVDVYSLGVVLYQMCCGVPPFVGNPMQVMRAQATQAPGRPEGIPDPLWELVAAMLARAPQERPGVLEVQRRLSEMVTSLAGLPAAPAITQPPPGQALPHSAPAGTAGAVAGPVSPPVAGVLGPVDDDATDPSTARTLVGTLPKGAEAVPAGVTLSPGAGAAQAPDALASGDLASGALPPGTPPELLPVPRRRRVVLLVVLVLLVLGCGGGVVALSVLGQDDDPAPTQAAGSPSMSPATSPDAGQATYDPQGTASPGGGQTPATDVASDQEATGVANSLLTALAANDEQAVWNTTTQQARLQLEDTLPGSGTAVRSYLVSSTSASVHCSQADADSRVPLGPGQVPCTVPVTCAGPESTTCPRPVLVVDASSGTARVALVTLPAKGAVPAVASPDLPRTQVPVQDAPGVPDLGDATLPLPEGCAVAATASFRSGSALVSSGSEASLVYLRHPVTTMSTAQGQVTLVPLECHRGGNRDLFHTRLAVYSSDRTLLGDFALREAHSGAEAGMVTRVTVSGSTVHLEWVNQETAGDRSCHLCSTGSGSIDLTWTGTGFTPSGLRTGNGS